MTKDFEKYKETIRSEAERCINITNWRVSKNTLLKFTEDGKFLRFPGDTVTAFIQTRYRKDKADPVSGI